MACNSFPSGDTSGSALCRALFCSGFLVLNDSTLAVFKEKKKCFSSCLVVVQSLYLPVLVTSFNSQFIEVLHCGRIN